MNKDTSTGGLPQPGQVELSAVAQQEWNAHVEAILRGVAHALNNRAAALSALIQLADDSEPAPTLRAILATELDRVTGLASALRIIGTPRPGEEAFAAADAASEALQVLALHADQRDATTGIDARDAAPVRAYRWMFVRALIVLAANAGRGNAGHVRVEIRSSGDHLIVSVASKTPAPSPYVQEIARAMGGEALSEGQGFRLPTLAALRRRAGS
jgi:hypothetical protein